MTKYIIELEDDIKYLIINGRTDNRCYTLVRPVEELEILNSDYINEHYGSLQDEAYQAGLNDAWGCMKSIAFINKPRDMRDFFGYSTLGGVLNGYTPSEAIAKLKAYEEKQKADDKIEVGDEVTHKSNSVVWKAVCIRIDGDRQHMNLMGYTGAVGYYPVDDFIKTGKHYDIQSILEAMRE